MDLIGSNLTSEVGLRLLLSPLGSNIVVRTSCCTVGVVLPVYSTFKAIERKNQDEQQKWLIYWAAYGSLSLAEVFADKLLSWVPMYYHMKFAFLVWLQLPSANEIFGAIVSITTSGNLVLLPLEHDIVLKPNQNLALKPYVRIRKSGPREMRIQVHDIFHGLGTTSYPNLKGAQQIYSNHLRPFFLRHQARVDLLVGFTYGEMVKIASKHQAEIGFLKSILSKFVGPAEQMRNRESNQSGEHLAIENETRVSTHIEADLHAFEQDARTITDTDSDHDD